MKPYGGVGPAIKLVMEAMNGGATQFFQSDIKAFFTKIPTQQIVDTVYGETKDEPLAELFSRALEVNLRNKDELLKYADIFPSGGIGVAQGSSLSTFAGNVLLLQSELSRIVWFSVPFSKFSSRVRPKIQKIRIPSSSRLTIRGLAL